MGRLFDEEELEKYIMHDGCEKGCGYIDERDLKYIQPVEAIPKDQYEARLNADMLAMLDELDLEVDELVSHFADGRIVYRYQLHNLIQEKINALKVENKMN